MSFSGYHVILSLITMLILRIILLVYCFFRIRYSFDFVQSDVIGRSVSVTWVCYVIPGNCDQVRRETLDELARERDSKGLYM